MPNSNDNQDYGKNDQKNKDQQSQPATEKANFTSDDLKGKKVDADVEKESDQPTEQKK